MKIKATPNFLLLLLLLFQHSHVSAASRADVTNDKVTFSFPETATFSATLTSSADIASVTLEYGNAQLTCGEVIAKAFPEFTPSTSVNVEWTWDMRQSGSLPPGASLWWRWRYTDATGAEFVSDTQTAAWLDDQHNWQTVSSSDINLHWYSGDQVFAQDLLNAAVGGLEFNKTESGLEPESPINVYVYADTTDMKDAILYEPSWTGGMAFPEHDVVIIGISQAELDWGRNAMVHELTHVLAGHLTFTCLGDVPTWLNEGLAVYSEGELEPQWQSQLDQAIKENTLLSVRSISGGFSEVTDKALLSYSQSYSIVNFLIKTYGQEKMTSLLVALRDGKTIDQSLLEVYGFDIDGLEDSWRQSVGAAPRTASVQPTAQPTPTHVPTIMPVSGAPLAITPTPYAIPTSSFGDDQSPSPTRSGPPIALTLALLGFCCVLLVIIGVFVLGIIVRSQNRKAGNNE
ncbi:MAG: hypothetical protein HZB19_15620 [Chloroflexi bacterium]|nr:hypothetical protein [Chloroflexota bacterium]